MNWSEANLTEVQARNDARASHQAGRLRADLKATGVSFSRLLGRQQLLARPSIAGMRLLPEEALSVAVADRLRALSLEGRLQGTWSHLPNEGHPSRLRTAAMLGAKRVAMGMVPGAPDFVFTWAGGCGWLELKTEGGDTYLGKRGDKLVVKRRRPTQLSEPQEWFRDWCAAEGVNWGCARSVLQVEEALSSWGAIRPPEPRARP